jgi:hypothetical protein
MNWNFAEHACKKESDHQLNLDAELQQAHRLLRTLQKITDGVDKTLSEHVIALEKQALKKLTALEKKLLRAERLNTIPKNNRSPNLNRNFFR